IFVWIAASIFARTAGSVYCRTLSTSPTFLFIVPLTEKGRLIFREINPAELCLASLHVAHPEKKVRIVDWQFNRGEFVFRNKFHALVLPLVQPGAAFQLVTMPGVNQHLQFARPINGHPRGQGSVPLV